MALAAKWIAVEIETTGTVYKVNPYFRWIAVEGAGVPNLFLYVKDKEGNPISGASVSASSTSWTASGTTDSDGLCALNLYENETATITISKEGYQTKTVKYEMNKKREEIEVLEPAVKLLMPMGEKIYKNLKPQDGQNKVLWVEV